MPVDFSLSWKEKPAVNPESRISPEQDEIADSIYSLDDLLVLSDISCVDADGNAFESYPKLGVKKDLFRNSEGQQINLKPYDAAIHCERNGLFLPSFALTCNIVAALYKNRTNPKAEALLQQYNDHGAGHGWHAQNTVVNWGTGQIIHYPHDSDFPVDGGTNNINQAQAQKKLPFNRTGFADTTLEEALKRPNFLSYIKNLTGLANPADLVEIGKYFGRTARVWVSLQNDTRAAWFGCFSDYFYLFGNYNLYGNCAVRGVRRGGAP